MANIYVRKSGNDSNDGSTPALAKLTIAGAISAMSSGDTIYVGSGIYREYNLTTGSKSVSIIGDITGLYTGDAGEVIWSGLNSTDDTYSEVSYAICSDTADYDLVVRNILFQNWKFLNGGFCILKTTNGDLTVDNCKAYNIYGIEISSTSRSFGFLNYSHAGANNDLVLTNIYLENIYGFASNSTTTLTLTIYGILVSKVDTTGDTTIENIKIKNIKGGAYDSNHQAISIVYALKITVGKTTKIRNIEVDDSNSYGEGNSQIYGFYLAGARFNIYNCKTHNLISSTWRSDPNLCRVYGFYASIASYMYNCSCFNLLSVYRNTLGAGSNYGVTEADGIAKANYILQTIEDISRYSPLLGLGNASYPTTDIKGNPRPAYGNGTACDIGAVESTSDIIQKESTIKDSGDYSVKVAPCNYFKKVFQIPVTASTLRTVKVKIRIDGTWGSYRPRVSLSGQGMTLSQSTKNATTEAFEELTVSGTPTTTGIALLTIEAHSASTDAVFYIDTITIE